MNLRRFHYTPRRLPFVPLTGVSLRLGHVARLREGQAPRAVYRTYKSRR